MDSQPLIFDNKMPYAREFGHQSSSVQYLNRIDDYDHGASVGASKKDFEQNMRYIVFFNFPEIICRELQK